LTGHPKPTRVCAAGTSTFGSPIEKYTYDEMWAGPPNPQGVFDDEDAITALIHFDNGMSLELNTTWAADLPNGIFRDGVLLLGDKGGCFFDLWSNEVILTQQQDGHLVDTKPTLPPGDAWTAAWQRQYEVFAKNLIHRKAPKASASDGRAVQRLLDALYRSAESGCEVQLG
ncbi:MAG: Gfo/Idh/MocA family oxidoreductase, partial [Phycisphaerales bacterium]